MHWLVIRDEYGQVYHLTLAEGTAKAGAKQNFDLFLCLENIAKEYVHEGSVVYVQRTNQLWVKEYLKVYRHVYPIGEDSFSIYP
jgi:ABC-type uncharacterized transport system ATPase subunit